MITKLIASIVFGFAFGCLFSVALAKYASANAPVPCFDAVSEWVYLFDYSPRTIQERTEMIKKWRRVQECEPNTHLTPNAIIAP